MTPVGSKKRQLRCWQSLAFITVALLGWVPAATAQPCTTNAECAAPLACKSRGQICSSSGTRYDGGFTVSDPVCVSEPAVCTWILTACQTDGDCSLPSWTCMILQGAQPTTHICYPKGIDCSMGAACPAGWSCVDFSTVKESEMADMWTSSGSTKFCWPSVLRGVPDKTTPADSSQLGITGVSGGSSESRPTIGIADGGASSKGGDASNLGAGMSKGSGCSMLGRPARPGLWLSFAILLAVRIGRKRATR